MILVLYILKINIIMKVVHSSKAKLPTILVTLL
jgi:hypothetical protein